MPSLVNLQPLLCTRRVNWSRYFFKCSNYLVFFCWAGGRSWTVTMRRLTVPGCFRHIMCVWVLKKCLHVICDKWRFVYKMFWLDLSESAVSDQYVLTPGFWVFLSLIYSVSCKMESWVNIFGASQRNSFAAFPKNKRKNRGLKTKQT